MADIRSRFNAQVSPMELPTLQLADAYSAKNSKMEQRYEALTSAAQQGAQMVGTVYNQQQKQMREEEARKLKERQEFEQVEAATNLKQTAEHADNFLEDPNNVGEDMGEAWKRFEQNNPTPLLSPDAHTQDVFALQRKRNFETQWQERKEQVDYSAKVAKVYEQTSLAVQDPKADMKDVDAYMIGQEISQQERANTMLLLGAQNPNSWKYIFDEGLGDRETQAKARAQYKAWQESLKVKKRKLDYKELLALEDMKKSGSLTVLEQLQNSDYWDMMSETQKAAHVKGTYTKHNENNLSIAAINHLQHGGAPEDLPFILKGTPQSHLEGTDNLGLVDLDKWLTTDKKNELIDAAAQVATNSNDTQTLVGLRSSVGGIPSERRFLSTQKTALVDEEGKLTSNAQPWQLTMDSNIQARGGAGALAATQEGDDALVTMYYAAQVNAGKDPQKVVQDIGIKMRDGTLKYHGKDDTWVQDKVVSKRKDARDELPTEQLGIYDNEMNVLGNMGVPLDEAHDQAIEKLKASNGELTAWFGTDYQIINGAGFTQDLEAQRAQKVYEADAHDVLNWHVKESIKLSEKEDLDSDDVVLRVQRGKLWLFDRTQGMSAPISEPVSVDELMYDFLENHPNERLPEG